MPQPPSCDEFDPNSLTVEQAYERIVNDVRVVDSGETVAIRAALNRVIAHDVAAPADVPAHSNSAMDGYAVRAHDLPSTGKTRLQVAGASFAGHPFDGQVGDGQCVRIMTGAVMPDGADTVIMQENTTRDGDFVEIGAGHTPGDNVRHPGEDLRAGDTVVERGRLVNAADIGLLASLGIAEVDVLRRPTVAYFSTGDELKGIGSPLQKGDIYDSNRYTLHAMLQRLPVETIDMGVVRDDKEDVEAAFKEAAENADLVITSGGVSVGEADYIKTTLEKLGQVGFWKIAMKPGRPLSFGHLGNTAFLGLPGNPVSVMATFLLFVRPALLKIAGTQPQPLPRFSAMLDTDLKKRPGRTDFQRGIYRMADDGKVHVSTTGLQGSHVLSSMSRANCLIELPREQGNVAAGERVDFIPLDALL
ncbi:MAG: molybdopterin molybdotransferase MoeA [Gammaproteobacteria bacterium]